MYKKEMRGSKIQVIQIGEMNNTNCATDKKLTLYDMKNITTTRGQ